MTSNLKISWLKRIKLSLDGFLHLIYPSACLICNDELSIDEIHICSICKQDLPRTYFEKYNNDSPMDKLFWGRVKVEHTYSYLLYKNLGSSKKLLTAIKYRNNPELARYFGEIICGKISFLDDVDVIIPVPLHRKKKFIRGYNQSEEISIGLATMAKIPLNNTLITRNEFTETQTKKGRYKRWLNVSGKFLIHPNISQYKHVLLIDDVVTTGATLESIIREIHQYNDEIKVSVVTLAIAS